MTVVAELRERFERVFQPTDRGVVGLVDDLLDLCPEQGLHLEWRERQCLIRALDGAPAATTQIPLQESVFRAMLARVAALCNELGPAVVSPYGGDGTFVAPASSSSVYHAAFANRPGELRLEIRVMK